VREEGHDQLQGDDRVRQAHAGLLEGRLRRERARWDDTNSNRAFHAGEIHATLNGASIYIADMYAKAVQGMKAEDAVKWAEVELKKMYRR
jgi:hypothetical protein